MTMLEKMALLHQRMNECYRMTREMMTHAFYYADVETTPIEYTGYQLVPFYGENYHLKETVVPLTWNNPP